MQIGTENKQQGDATIIIYIHNSEIKYQINPIFTRLECYFTLDTMGQ